MDISKMSNADKLIAVGAIAAIVGCFLPWHSLYFISVSGLHGFGIIVFIAAIASLLVVGLPLFGQTLPTLPVKESVLQMILGTVVTGGTLIQLLSFGTTGVSFGIFVTLAGGAIIVFGGYQKQQKPTTPTV